jgi:putative phosphoesterase
MGQAPEVTLRLAILSDIHGNLVALEAVLADLKTRAVDAIVNLGDCVTSPLWPRETFDLLETLKLPTVRGNHDRWLTAQPTDSPTVQFAHDALTAAQRGTLGDLPPSLRIEPDILAVHGTPTSDVEYLLEEAVDGRLSLVTPAVLQLRLGAVSARVILCGHSHHQHSVLAPGNRLVINPGSVGCPRYADDSDRFLAEAGSPHARYAVATRRGQQWTVELIVLDYDWTRVVEQAERNGRDDWAEGFLGDPG